MLDQLKEDLKCFENKELKRPLRVTFFCWLCWNEQPPCLSRDQRKDLYPPITR